MNKYHEFLSKLTELRAKYYFEVAGALCDINGKPLVLQYDHTLNQYVVINPDTQEVFT